MTTENKNISATEESLPSDCTEYDTEYETGQDNVEVLGLDVHNPVFFLSASLVIIFALLTLVFPSVSGDVLSGSKAFTIDSFDWLFAITPIVVFIFALIFTITPLGKIRLGGASATPDFKLHSWIAMLFSAGVGVGFMFWGAAEPLGYYTNWFGTPLNAEAGTEEARRLAMSATIVHWGIIPWAIYAMVGLALAFFAHNKGLPMSIRSAFYPLLGDRIWGWPGHIIDLFAVVSTVFGLATTIGLGGTQAANGLAYVFGFEPNIWVQIALIMTMTALAIFSVIRGMDGGVKLLSNINMSVAFVLLVFVIVSGPSLLLFTSVGQNFVNYIIDSPALLDWRNRTDVGFFHDWTIFYWAWWVSWSPFVGMFIARISRGRTVREFFLVVLLVPFTICLIWFSTFGELAIDQYNSGVGELSEGITDFALVTFQLLRELPYPEITTYAAIGLLIVFIVTSADSGALVVDTITSGGKTDAPVVQRVFWTTMLGVTASALLYGGGTGALNALQAGTITAALPFTFVLLACCVTLTMGLMDEHKANQNQVLDDG